MLAGYLLFFQNLLGNSSFSLKHLILQSESTHFSVFRSEGQASDNENCHNNGEKDSGGLYGGGAGMPPG